ncbi:MAG: L-fucokinase [Armatimonadota bacterium]
MTDIDRLRQLIRRHREAYLSGDAGWPWDLVILTAASRRQAEGYRAALQLRRNEGFLPPDAEVIVIHDLDEWRIGSGGATMQAAAEAATRLDAGDIEDTFSCSRVLVMHCGGDSKRIPQYSATGKIFATFPARLPSGRISTLFDEWLMALCGWAERLPAGLLAVSGDVLITLDPDQLDFTRADLTGVACPAPWQQAVRHGVYVTNEDGELKHFLQKPSHEALRAVGGIANDGTALIDTGVMALSPTLAADFARMGGARCRQEGIDIASDTGLLRDPKTRGVEIDLYDEIACRLSPDYDEAAYMSGAAGEKAVVRRQLADLLSDHSFSVSVARPAHFLHMGTTRQFRDALIDSDLYDFPPQLNASLSRVERCGSNRIYDAVLTGNDASIGTGCVIEKSDISGHFTIGDGSVVSGVETDVESLNIAADVALSQTPLALPGEEKCFVTRIFGVSDNPKDTVASGEATLFGHDLLQWLAERGIAHGTVWDDYDPARACLWEARLYPTAPDPASSLRQVQWMQEAEAPDPDVIEAWESSRRLSLKEISRLADCCAAIERESSIRLRARAAALCQQAVEGAPLEELTENARGENREDLCRCVTDRAKLYDAPLQRARIHALAAHLTEAPDRHWDGAFAQVGEAVSEGLQECELPVASASEGQGWVVEIAARIDFGGGWSDTPPYSLENGGTVLNAAVLVDGEYPIRVTARCIQHPVFHFESSDQQTSCTARTLQDLRRYESPREPLSLHRAVACSMGLAGTSSDRTLRESLLDRIGGGIELVSESRLPRGCGLGGSSIITGALLSALYRLMGRAVVPENMFQHILYVEQMLTTGGGWQDQVGAMTPGLKLITTEPAYQQIPDIQPVALAPDALEDLHDHLVLFNVGKRRLAKNILRTIMGRYLSGDSTVKRILSEIQELARQMQKAVEQGDHGDLGRLMQRHWIANKTMDPHSTTPYIERLFDAAKPFISGGKLTGAGGGGFMIMVLKDPGMREELLNALNAQAQASEATEAREYAVTITHQPMRIKPINA